MFSATAMVLIAALLRAMGEADKRWQEATLIRPRRGFPVPRTGEGDPRRGGFRRRERPANGIVVRRAWALSAVANEKLL